MKTVIIKQTGHASAITAIKKVGNFVLSGDNRGKICIWDRLLKRNIGWINAHSSAVRVIEWIPDNKLIVTASARPEVKFWSWGKFNLVSTLKAHSSSVINVVYKNNYLYTAGREGNIKKWAIERDIIKMVKKVKIARLEEVFVIDNKIITSCSDGTVLHLKEDNSDEFKTLKLKDRKVISAIRHGLKKIEELKGRSYYSIFQKMRRINGIPLTSATYSDNEIVLGHVGGIVSTWDRNRLKFKKIFFINTNNIINLILFKDQIISISFNYEISIFDKSNNNLKFIERSCRPTSLLKIIESDKKPKLLVGYETGSIEIINPLDFSVEFAVNAVNKVEYTCICPNQILIATKNGVIQRKAIKEELEDLPPIYLNEMDEIRGIYYYKGKIAIIDKQGKIIITDEELNTIKNIEYNNKNRTIIPEGYGRYIALSSNFLLDLENLKIIKGEVSNGTKQKFSEGKVYSIAENYDDIIIHFEIEKLEDITRNKKSSIYSEEELEAINKLVKQSEKQLYQQVSEQVFLIKNYKNILEEKKDNNGIK